MPNDGVVYRPLTDLGAGENIVVMLAGVKIVAYARVGGAPIGTERRPPP